jgi:transposase-like protein
MPTASASPSYNHKAWLYYWFSLSYRDLEELMATPGIVRAYADTVK